MIQQMGRGYMTASKAVAVFRHGLNDELGVAAAARYDAQAGVDHRTSRIFAATYRIAARLAPGAEDLAVALLEEHTPDFSEQDRRAVVLMLKSCAPHRVSGKIAHYVLKNLGDRVVGDAGVQLLLGRAEAQARMALSDHPDVAAGGDPVSALLDDALVTRIRTAMKVPARGDVSDNTTPFLMVDTRRLTEVIDDTVADIQASGDWNEDVAQRARVIGGFCAFVAGQVVEDDDVAGVEFGHEILADILGEDRPVHRLIDDEGGDDAVAGEACEEGRDFPVPGRCIAPDPLSPWAAPIAPDHVGGDAGLVEEDQALGTERRLHRPPCLAPRDDVRPELLGGVDAFFEADPVACEETAQHPGIGLHPMLRQQALGDREQGQVRFRLDRRDAPTLSQRLKPTHRRCVADPIAPGRLTSRQTLILDSSDHTIAQILRIRSRHPCRPPTASTFNQNYPAMEIPPESIKSQTALARFSLSAT